MAVKKTSSFSKPQSGAQASTGGRKAWHVAEPSKVVVSQNAMFMIPGVKYSNLKCLGAGLRKREESEEAAARRMECGRALKRLLELEMPRTFKGRRVFMKKQLAESRSEPTDDADSGFFGDDAQRRSVRAKALSLNPHAEVANAVAAGLKNADGKSISDRAQKAETERVEILKRSAKRVVRSSEDN